MSVRIELPGLVELMALQHEVIVERPCSVNWNGHIGLKAGSGWNPLSGKLYLPRDSVALAYLRDPACDVRDLNQFDDRLVRGLFGLSHDFLHLIATAWCLELAPARLFEDKLGARNLEEHVFLLLLGEAVAVVGLDYWFLSCREQDFLKELGSLQSGYAVSYRASDAVEYARFSAGWSTEHVGFFEALVDFYCSGVFRGFSVEHVRTCPRLHAWLSHELQYGEAQRSYARGWLSHMLGREYRREGERERPVRSDKPWMRKLIGAIGERLWSWLRGREPIAFRPYRTPPAFASINVRPDAAWRYTNAAAFSQRDWLARAATDDSLLVDQLIALTPFPKDRDAVRAVREARGHVSAATMIWLLKGLGLNADSCEAQAALFFPR